MKYLVIIFLFLVACDQENKVQTAPSKIVWEFSESLNQAKENSKIFGQDSIEIISGAETDFFIDARPIHD